MDSEPDHKTPPEADPYDLARFLRAQERDYPRALADLRSGRKRSHWMWYIFPQFRGLGFSAMSRRYAIASIGEAQAFLRLRAGATLRLAGLPVAARNGTLLLHPSRDATMDRTTHASRTLTLALCAYFALSRPGAAQDASGAPYPRPAGTHEVTIERSVMVPMRDGVKLATDIYRPTDITGALPTVLMRTPYNKAANPAGDASARFFASHGYAVAVQDVRGKFASEGQFHVYEGDMTDWSDMFDWIGAQPWSTGRIGTYGCSYLGEGQIIAAQQHHPRHIAAIPQAAGGNLGRVGRSRQFWGSVEGGAFEIAINFGWMPVYASLDKGARPLPTVDFATFFRTLPVIDMTDRAGSPSWDWRNFLERSPDDPWWDKKGYLTAGDSVSVAALHVSSWFDMADGALEEAAIFRKNGLNERARSGQYAIVSPTTHCSSERATSQTKVGDLPVGDARLHYFETYLAWFDRWLRGNERALDGLPRIQYYVIGRNEWRTSDRWPVSGMRETAFYLHSDGGANSSGGNGRLSLAPPARERADTFTYDPANPVPARGGSICCTGNPKDVPGSFDNADIEQRPDVLVYTSDVFREGLELTGPMRAVAYLSSDARDTDLTVKLLDVFPDGRSMNMQEGITRVRYRDGFDKARMMEPGKVYEVPVELHVTSWYLPPGHRLRAEISSSNFPHFDRNLNTGGHNYDETTWRSAKNTVHHSALQASRLILPVVQAGSVPAPGAPKARQEITLDPAVLDRYVGDYELAPSFHIVITREGAALFGQATDQPKFPLFAESETTFFLKVVDAQVTFVKDASSAVTTLVLHQNGQDLAGKRKY